MQKYIDKITALNGRWEAGKLLNDLGVFEWMDCNQIAQLYLKCWAGQDIEKNLNKLHDLNFDTAKLLIQRWASATMINNMESFIKNDREEIISLLAKYGYLPK